MTPDSGFIKTDVPGNKWYFIYFEPKGNMARETVAIASGNSISIAEVVSQEVHALGALVPGTNTGTGSVTAIALGGSQKIGNYVLTCTAVATDGGTFQVTDPDGYRMEDAEVGVAYSNSHIGFTINDDTTDYVLGDSFEIPVEAGSGKWGALDFTKLNGQQTAGGVSLNKVDATGGDSEAVLMMCDCKLRQGDLIFPTGTTDDQKAQAYLDLKNRNIQMRGV